MGDFQTTKLGFHVAGLFFLVHTPLNRTGNDCKQSLHFYKQRFPIKISMLCFHIGPLGDTKSCELLNVSLIQACYVF